MRLLCVTNLFPDTTQPWRGLDNVTLLHAMRQLRPDAEIRVLCLRPGHRYWLGSRSSLQPRPGDEVLRPSFHWTAYIPKFGGLNDVFFDWALRKALRSLPEGWKPDALLVPWLFPDACGVSRCPKLSGLPVLAVAQGSDVHWYLSMPARRRAIQRLAQLAAIITRSEDLRKQLTAAGANGERVRTVYNGVDTQAFHPGPAATERESLGLPAEGRLLLFVGNFYEVKGLDLLIQAAAEVKKQLPEPLHLVMIGSGPLEAELMALADSSGLGRKSVILAGRRAPAEVAQFMRACDAVCLSSHNEGVPNVLFEAFATGKPLVTTDVGGISEIAGPSPGGGLLVKGRSPKDYAEALLKALRDPPDSLRLSQYGATFAWENCARQYWETLDEAMAGSAV